jgi:hypothetical protein
MRRTARRALACRPGGSLRACAAMPAFDTRSSAILACCVLLAGCALVDQRSFDGRAGRAPTPPEQPQAAGGPAPVPPLFVVRAGQLEQDWQPDLRRAVGAALARKPNVLFTVESVAPAAQGASSPAAQAAALRAAVSLDGRPVAQAISADGADPAQIEMTAMADPAAHASEVRVYVH